MKTNHYVRQTTKNWLKKQDCTVVAYWGKTESNLWDVLDIYAQAVVEGDSTEEAVYDNFPVIAQDIQISVIQHGEFNYSTVIREFVDCPHKMIFLYGEQVDVG